MSSQSIRPDEEESGPEEHDSLKEVFRDNQGNPIWFFLHKSITLDWQRQNLTNDIQSNGGIVRPTDSEVDTVLVGHSCNKDNLQLAYNSHSKPSKRRIWVEPMSFVSKCLREGVVRHRKPESKGMGGSLGNRTPFTYEDDEYLARYIAIRIPNVKSGGRRGDNVFKELYRAYSEDSEEYAWVTRHSWQSWRNRYNKNVTRFDDMINVYVKLEKPEHKQAYRLQRKPNKRLYLNESREEDEEQSGSPIKRRRLDFSPDVTENAVHIKRTLAGKGKGRMVPEDASDTHREFSPIYEDIPPSEPGPSKRTPIITYAHRSKKRPLVSPPIHDPEPYTSQATLVGTDHQTQEPGPRKGTVSDLPSQQRERSNATWRETGVGVQQDGSPLLNKEPDALVAPVSSTQVSSAGAHRPMARKTAQRDKPPLEIVKVASRSRSVEPSILPSRLETRRRNGMASEPHRLTLSLMEESMNENEQLVEDPETHRPPEPIEETLEEEQSVEDLLVNTSGRSQASENATDDNANEPTSLDSDDAQVDNWLRQPQFRAQIRLPPESDVSPDEMLRRFREASINTLHSPRAPSVRPTPFSQARADSRRPRHSAPVYSQDIFSGVSLTEEQSRTHATNPRFRSGSASSTESFPIVGTKASAVKRNIEMEEKHTPYRPPVGTRAALLTGKQTRISRR